MRQDPSPSESSNQEDTITASNQEDNTMTTDSPDPENVRKKDPKRLRDLLTPLLDLDEDTANLQNLDKMLADRFAQFTERRKQLQAMKDENERELVIKMLDEEEASRPQDWSQYAEEHHQEEDVSDEVKHLKDE